MSTTDAPLKELLDALEMACATFAAVAKRVPERGDEAARFHAAWEYVKGGCDVARATLAQQAPAVAGRPGAVILNGAHVCCEEFDREPCPHQPERRCKACPGNAQQAPAAEPVALSDEQIDAAHQRAAAHHRVGAHDFHRVFAREVLAAAPQPPQAQPLTCAARRVIDAARTAMDESFEAGNESQDVSIPAHLAAALSLRLDEFDAAAKPITQKPLKRAQVDRIFDAHQEAPTMAFRYLVTEAIERAHGIKGAA